MVFRKTTLCIVLLAAVISLTAPLQRIHADEPQPSIIISDYRALTPFSGSQSARIMKGDDVSYRTLSFDDRKWPITALPSSWTKIYPEWTGICWYRIHITFPEKLPRQAVGVELGIIVDTDETYFNGELIGSSGEMGNLRKSAYDKKRIYEIPALLIQPGKDNVLAIRVHGLFSGYNGIHKGNLRIAPLRELQRRTFFSEVTEMAFVVVYLVFAIYFMLLFVNRAGDRSYLHFALYCLIMSMYFILRTQLKHHADINFYWSKKLEYFLLPLLVLQALEFTRSYFKQQRNMLYYIYYAMAVASMLLVLFTGSYQQWKNINHFINQPSWILGIGILFYILIHETWKKNRDALSMLIGFSLLLIIMINDILIDRQIYDFYRLDNYGFFFIIVSIAAIINRNFVQMHNRLEDLSLNLENKVQKRTQELNDTNARLTGSNLYITELNDRYLKDFKLASKVQMGLIPSPLSNAYWQSSVFFRPSALVSGDFYDMYTLDSDTLGVTIADASGHGIASALVTMISKPIFLQRMKQFRLDSLGPVLNTINAEITEEIGDIDNFLSAIIVRLGKDTLTIANAGHPPALLRRPDGSIQLLESSGSFLGIPLFITPYASETAEVVQGSTLLLFTDALIESWNDNHEEFGLARVIALLKEKDRSADELIKDLTDALFSFTGSPALEDDIYSRSKGR